MKFRNLRIAWSVISSAVALLVIVLSFRSYWISDVVQWSATKWTGLQLTSQRGQLTGRRCDLDGASHHGGMDFPDWRWSQSRPGSFSTSPTKLGFNLGNLSFYVALPYWPLVAFCASLAAAPVIIGRQRPQFSLRTLLIATTLVAVALGLIMLAIRK